MCIRDRPPSEAALGSAEDDRERRASAPRDVQDAAKPEARGEGSREEDTRAARAEGFARATIATPRREDAARFSAEVPTR